MLTHSSYRDTSQRRSKFFFELQMKFEIRILFSASAYRNNACAKIFITVSESVGSLASLLKGSFAFTFIIRLFLQSCI